MLDIPEDLEIAPERRAERGQGSLTPKDRDSPATPTVPTKLDVLFNFPFANWLLINKE